MANLTRLFRILTNKYLVVGVIMMVMLTFFDRFKLTRRRHDRAELYKLEQDCKFYEQGIARTIKKKDELFSSPKYLERFAREQYLMKRDSEDVFLVEYSANALGK